MPCVISVRLVTCTWAQPSALPVDGPSLSMAAQVNRVMASTVEGGGMEDMVVIRAIQDKSVAHGVQGLCAGMVLKEISGAAQVTAFLVPKSASLYKQYQEMKAVLIAP